MGMRTFLVATDINDPNTGEPLCVYFTPLPTWRWRLRQLRFFASILWRRHEDQRIGWRLAWGMADLLYADDINMSKKIRQGQTRKDTHD